ncbi:hypothetical protein EVAR_45621_1 [Eumeta japonica]|uniref:Uncharacterized protein n=1 Tax=Eumeta variegata TaxID=151549 RepID=A0A4C1WHF7_EUMVA|nr:hypothetical protein EVAR_45621_1 [Eumeta japonica]
MFSDGTTPLVTPDGYSSITQEDLAGGTFRVDIELTPYVFISTDNDPNTGSVLGHALNSDLGFTIDNDGQNINLRFA